MADPNTQFPTIPLDGGLDTLSAPEVVQPGRHLIHEDMSFREPGALNKRRAYATLPISAQVGTGAAADRTSGFHRMHVDRGALLAVGADDSRSYELSANENRWLAAESAHAFPVTIRHDVLKDIKAKYLDVARVTGWLMVFVCNQPDNAGTGEWRDYEELCCLLIDENDKVVRHTQDALGGEHPVSGVKLATVSDRYIMAVWVDGTNLRAAVFDTQTIRSAWSAPVTVATTHATARDFDVASDGTNVFVAHASATKLATVKLGVSASAPSIVTAATDVVGSSLPNARVSCALDLDAGHALLLVVYGNSVAGILKQTVNKTTLAGVASQALDPTVTAPTAITCQTYVLSGTNVGSASWSASSPKQEAEQYTNAALFLLASSTVLASGLNAGLPWLKPFRFRGVDYFSALREQHPEQNSGAFADKLEQATVYTVAHFVGGTNDALVCRMLPYTADHMYYVDPGGGAPVGRTASVVRGDVSSRFWTVLFEPGQPSNDPAKLPQSGTVALFEIDFGHDIAGRAIEFDGHLHVAGSVPRRYERQVFSANVGGGSGNVRSSRGLVGLVPYHSPSIDRLTPSASTGALSSGDYLYRFTWEYTAADGRRVQSLPSPAISVTVNGGGGENTVTVDLGTVVPGPAARMLGALRLLVWRTVVNPTEPIFYLSTRVELNAVTHPDLTSDTVLATRPTLYTVSGELENEGAPPCLALAKWKGRLVALNSETAELWISKSLIPGEYPGFSSALTFDTNVHSKRPIFISTIGTALLVWWEDAIGVVEGEPPNDAGQGGTIRPPVIFATGVGLAERASLVETPIGVFFRSKRGIQLLGLDLSVQFVGDAVAGIIDAESWSSSNAIVAAVYLHARSEVRFVLAHDQTLVDSELVGCSYLVYNIERKQWHTHALGDTGAGESSSPTIADAVEYGGQMAVCWASEFKTAARIAWVEDEDASADPASTSRPRAQQQTGWLDLAGKLGNQRVRAVWFRGTFPSGSKLRIEYDYQESTSWTYAKPANVVTNDVRTFGNGVAGQAYIAKLGIQDCSVIRLTWRGHTRLLGMARVEVAPEGEPYKRRAIQI